MSVAPSTPPLNPSVAQTPVPPRGTGRGWTAGRVVALVAGCLGGVVALGLLGAGGWATWMTTTQRDSTGYLTATSRAITTSGNAIVSKEVGDLVNGPYSGWLGTVRVRVTTADPSKQLFVGVASSADIDRYLSGVGRTVVSSWYPLQLQQIADARAAPAQAC